MSPLVAIVLAAGQGTRMKSPLPKVLFPLAGRPMAHHVVNAALDAGVSHVVVVVGHGRDEVAASLTDTFGARVSIAIQERQLGTGHAVREALPSVPAAAERCLILCGDTPLLEAAELARLPAALPVDAPLGMFTMRVPAPHGYGRILRDEKRHVVAIREERDASHEEKLIDEVNPAVYLARVAFLTEALAQLDAKNAQNELYLTDVVALAAKSTRVVAIAASDATSFMGINNRDELARAEELIFERIARRHRINGVTVRRSARIDATVVIEENATIEHDVVLRGATHIGTGALIDVGSVLTDVVVEPEAVLKPYSVATSSTIGPRAQIGPFSHLRPDSNIEEEAHIGNFVETKKTHVRKGAKANHLAYLGDADVGERANIGAGTIFCNYDGFRKHRTVIGKGAFIGSDSQLIAPVHVGQNAYVATGTTVTKDVPDEALAIGRIKQENKDGYAPRLRARLASSPSSKPKEPAPKKP